ncbi:MAG: amidase family protein, partial [Planctomycetota bacterium]
MIGRRELLHRIAATGIGCEVFHRAIVAQWDNEKGLTKNDLQMAAWVSGFPLEDQDAEKILKRVSRNDNTLNTVRKISIPHNLAPSFEFKPITRSESEPTETSVALANDIATGLPDSEDEIAFLPVTALGQLIKSRQLTSTRLTNIYLKRLKKYGPMLRCVVNLTEELAFQQAAQADREIAAGQYKGPLHGIPWGAKDLISVPDYPTTWGIPHYQNRVAEESATVFNKLSDAGAVLVAKLSLGALAMGDQWFGGMTRNPLNPKTGSSGSSAGSAAATVA